MDWKALSEMFCIDIPTLQSMTHWRQAKTPGRQAEYDFFDHIISKYIVRVTQPKLCPGCLRDANYIRKVWDLAASTACPIHKCMLVDECPACGRNISWDRSGVSICKCKYDWRSLELVRLEEADILLSRQIYSLCKLGLGNDVPVHATANEGNPLYSLELPELLSTMFFILGQLGGMVDVTGKFQASRLGNFQLHRGLVKLFSIFDDWPDNYFKFLEEVKGSQAIRHGETGIYKDFGKLYNYLYCRNDLLLPAFLKEGFEKYLVMSWNGGRTPQFSTLSKNTLNKRKYFSRNEAAEALQLSYSWVEYLLECKMLKAVIKKIGKKRLILIEAKSVRELKAQLDSGDLMTFEQVMNIFGVGKKAVFGLIHNGCLSAFRGPSVDGYSHWIFQKEGIDNFLSRIDERTRKLPALCGGELIGFYCAVKKLSPLRIKVDSFLKLILDGDILPYGDEAKKGLSGLMFDNVEIMDYLRSGLKNRREDSLTLEEAAKVIGTKYETLKLLIKKELITSEKIRTGNYCYSLISKDEVKRFKSAYAITGDMARQVGTSPRFLADRLMANGIVPVSGPKIDSCRQYFFKKSDIDGLDIGDLIRTGNQGML